MRKNRILSLITALFLLLGMLPAAVYADDTADNLQYLALGDSISTGYALGGGHFTDENFVNIVAAAGGYTVTNKAIDGNTAVGIYAQISEGALDTEITEADLITITCGGNDMMAILYQMIAQQYTLMTGAEIDASDVVMTMIGGDDAARISLLGAASAVLPGFSETEVFQTTLDVFITNFNLVLSYIRALNSEATVIVNTQYNPYHWFTSPMFTLLNTEIDAGAARLSQAITDNAPTGGYLIADVYTAFNTGEANLSNASDVTMELDFHPNADGHAVIAECVQAVLDDLDAEAETETEEPTPASKEPNAYSFTLVL